MREAAKEINVDINEYMCSFPIDTYLNNLNDTLSISQEKPNISYRQTLIFWLIMLDNGI
ncbi:Hypothetical protein RY67_2304 [Bifidobacterium longum subsp. infantis]|uniref:Uncharacterized protein n=2 Tax=Bifidobacterium longum TaxID=216816 RepID=A0A0M5KWR1_BIFLI|nr:Hypothetical protein RY67_2304 [Bifidobacterium longum subsp. infantis]